MSVSTAVRAFSRGSCRFCCACALTINGRLDLANNSMILQYTPPIGSLLNQIRQQLRTGVLFTSLAGSKTRLGYADNAILGKSTFAGQSVGSSSVLVKYTQIADADLDGDADGIDIGVWATNRPEWVVAQFATAAVGAVLVTVNPAYRAHELAYVLDQADVTTLLLTDRFKNSDYFGILAEVCPELAQSPPGGLRAAACPKLRHVVSVKPEKRPGMWGWDEFLALAELYHGRLDVPRSAGIMAVKPPPSTDIQTLDHP